jgi:excisionase family DNA binding protein
MPPAPPLLTTDEVATLLRIDVRTVRRWIGDGQVESVKVGAQYRIPRRSLERFIGATIEQLAGA